MEEITVVKETPVIKSFVQKLLQPLIIRFS